MGVSGVSSQARYITSGDLQGSVLGPLLFLNYINDIGNSISGIPIKLFADDTNLFIFIVALCNRADHYIFILFLSFFLLSFFPRLISAVGDWTSTILQHMVWS